MGKDHITYTAKGGRNIRRLQLEAASQLRRISDCELIVSFLTFVMLIATFAVSLVSILV